MLLETFLAELNLASSALSSHVCKKESTNDGEIMSMEPFVHWEDKLLGRRVGGLDLFIKATLTPFFLKAL